MTEAEIGVKADMKDREEALNQREHALQMQAYSIEAQKQLKDNGLSANLVDMVLSDDVKVTQQRIKTLADQFNQAVQAKVKELSKTGTPNSSAGILFKNDSLAAAIKRQLKQ